MNKHTASVPDRIRQALKKYGEFLKFNLVGLLNTLVDFLLFSLLTWTGVPYLISQCFSYAGGVANSYILNKNWTFGSRKPRGAGLLIRFLLVNGIALGLSLVLLYVFKAKLGMHSAPAKILVTAITMLVNYMGSKLWVFRKRSNAQSE